MHRRPLSPMELGAALLALALVLAVCVGGCLIALVLPFPQ